MRPKNSRRDDPELIGVEVMPLAEYLAALDASAEATRRALERGDVAASVEIPKRIRPVMRDRCGRRVVPVPTKRGIEYRGHAVGPALELPLTGGTAGGFLDLRDVPPVAPGGGGSPADWARGYVSELPKHQALDRREVLWQSRTQAVGESVSATRRTSDEWRQAYFAGIREASRNRFEVTASDNARPREKNAVQQTDKWKQDEYHQAFFNELRASTEALITSSRSLQESLPIDPFAAALDPGVASAIHRAKRRLNAGTGDLLLDAVQQQSSDQVREFLTDYVQQRASALTQGGGPLHALRKAFNVIDQLNEVGAIELLAGLADSTIFPTGPDGKPNPVNLDLLKKQFGDKLAMAGFNKAFEKLLGEDTAAALKKAGITEALAGAATDLLRTGGDNLSGIADDLMDKLPGAAVDQALDKLLGDVTDSASMARQVAAKYKAQLKSLLKDLLSADGREALVDKLDAMFNGIDSAACIPFGLANPAGGSDMVYINGLPATRLNDDCDMPAVPDKGKFFQGNPTILVNGMPPAGEIHAAIGSLGTIATPMVTAPNVLMGECTVTVAIRVETEAPEAAAGSAAPAAQTAGNADSTGDTPADPEEGTASPPQSEDATPTDSNDPSAARDTRTPEELGQAGADKGRELLDQAGGDKYKARQAAIDARREHYDNELANVISKRDGLSPSEKASLYDRIRNDQDYRASQVARLTEAERDGLHDPVLTNADRYLETRIQAEKCGISIADTKGDFYDLAKNILGTSDATDNDGRSSSATGMGQQVADRNALRDAWQEGAGLFPDDWGECMEQNLNDIKHMPGL